MTKVAIPKTDASDVLKRISQADLVAIAEAFRDFEGATEVFESAVGALIVGRFMGFDALRVLHGSRTIKRYEEILGITFRRTLAPRTSDSLRLNGIRYAEKFKAFWKALAAGVASEPGAREVVKG
jgi:hypothetical protein